MNSYIDFVNKFKKISEELDDLIKKFPAERREEIVFDKWSLKNIVSHLNHWMLHDIDCLELLMQEKEPYWEPNVEDFNKKGVEERKGRSWESIYSEFQDLKERLVGLYLNLPTKLRDKKFWSNKSETPTEFLKEDINHWRNEHVAQLENYFKK